MRYKDILAEAARSKVMASVRADIVPDELYISVWHDDIRVLFYPEGDVFTVKVYSMNTHERTFPTHKTMVVGKCDMEQIAKFIRLLGSTSPSYVVYALRNAGIMSDTSEKFYMEPAGVTSFWR